MISKGVDLREFFMNLYVNPNLIVVLLQLEGDKVFQWRRPKNRDGMPTNVAEQHAIFEQMVKGMRDCLTVLEL